MVPLALGRRAAARHVRRAALEAHAFLAPTTTRRLSAKHKAACGHVSCEGRWGLGTGDPDCGDTQCCTCGKCTPGHWGRDAGDCVCTPGPIPDGVDPAYIDPDAGSFDINQYGQYFFTTRTICCDVTGPTALGECIEVPP